jgi:3-oxoacyl-[acyl-carrier protein] reductase
MSTHVALITGGAKGIGRAIALDLAAQQWSVAICYRTSNAAAEETSAAIRARGGQALAVQCDVSDPQAAKGLVAQVESAVGSHRRADQWRRPLSPRESLRRDAGGLA